MSWARQWRTASRTSACRGVPSTSCPTYCRVAAPSDILVFRHLEYQTCHVGGWMRHDPLSYRALALTDEDRRQLTARGLAVDSGLVRYLYEVAVPMPSATAGFAANQQALHTYLNRLGYDVLVFLRGLAAGERFAEAGAPVV